MNKVDFPFAALVGQEQLKIALLLNAVHPGIGGVLIRGEKGTAKSTAARALAALLPPLHVVADCPFHCDPGAIGPDCPHCSGRGEFASAEMPVPFVDLPLGATEDRVVGTLDFERALREGRRAFQPGLLAAAHRGILYIDEVNLLPDHLVDVLLDAAASGINSVQREGMAVVHPARFLLVGTMNPEEGELRPQLLDRFGLMVEVRGPQDPEVRAEVVRRRLAFEADPSAFATRWTAEQANLRQQIITARQRLDSIQLEDGLLTLLTRLCCEFAVDGLRADIALHKTAVALAAWHGRESVAIAEIRAAAELVLPHRRQRRRSEPPRMESKELDNALANAQRESSPSPASPTAGKNSPATEEVAQQQSPSDSHVFAPRQVQNIVLGNSAEPCAEARALRGGKQLVAPSRDGPYIRAVPNRSDARPALEATLCAAALNGGYANGRLQVDGADLRWQERSGRTGRTILFVVDASGSMAARRRMELVKGAVLNLLEGAQEQRDRVGVIAFRGPEAELLLPPTRSSAEAEQTLRSLPTGGRTPLAHALVLAAETIRREHALADAAQSLMVVLSDGKANVSLPGTTDDPWQQALQAAADLATARVPALVLDSDAGFVRLERARQLAEALGAEYRALQELAPEQIVSLLRNSEAAS